MEQTKLESLIESTFNVGSGFIIALLLWAFILVPYWGFKVTMWDNLAITAIFTGVSIIRGYIWRRFFNAGLHKKVHRIVGAMYGWAKGT